MIKQITLEEALELVSFQHVTGRGWQICDVFSTVYGNVKGNVFGAVYGYVKGDVFGTIRGREWESVETPKDKLQRLLNRSSEEELLKLINHIENN